MKSKNYSKGKVISFKEIEAKGKELHVPFYKDGLHFRIFKRGKYKLSTS